MAYSIQLNLKNPLPSEVQRVCSYGRRDSNPHTLRHQILSLARLPISPRPHFQFGNYQSTTVLLLKGVIAYWAAKVTSFFKSVNRKP